MQGRKYSRQIRHLIRFNFSPPIRSTRPKIVRWELPPIGKLMLNIDATVGSSRAAAAAVLRTHTGDLISAICFYLPAMTPLRAELMALQYALIYYSRNCDHLILETCCKMLLHHLSTLDKFTGPYVIDLQRTIQFLCLNSSSLSYSPRETNTAAHTLSRHGLRSVGVTLFTSLSSLPCEVQGAIILDSSVPNLRF